MGKKVMILENALTLFIVIVVEIVFIFGHAGNIFAEVEKAKSLPQENTRVEESLIEADTKGNEKNKAEKIEEGKEIEKGEESKSSEEKERKKILEVEYKDGLLSADLENVDIIEVLKKIGELANIEIEIGLGIEGTIEKTKFKKLSLEKAIERLIEPEGSGIVVEYSVERAKRVKLFKKHEDIRAEKKEKPDQQQETGKKNQMSDEENLALLKKQIMEKALEMRTSCKVSKESVEWLKRNKSEIYHEMGWEGGKYDNEIQEEYIRTFFLFGKEGRGGKLDKLTSEMEKNQELYLRPFTELICDPRLDNKYRRGMLSKLGWTKVKKAIPIVKRFIDFPDTSIQISAGNALYNLGEKNTAFEVYERLVKAGERISNKYFDFSEDPEAKKVLFKTIKYDNPRMQALGLYYLAKMGEKDSIMEIYINLKKDLKEGKVDINNNKNVDSFLNWAADEMGLKE